MAKRTYNRRSDAQLIKDLEKKIASIQGRIEARQRKDAPVLKELPKVQRNLRGFAQKAVDHGREDLSNMTIAFLAGLERAANTPPAEPARRSRAQED